MIDHGRTESQLQWDLKPIFQSLKTCPLIRNQSSTLQYNTSLIFTEHIKHKTNDTQASGFVLFLLRRGPVSRHTSTKTRLSSLLELWDSCHTTAAYKTACQTKQPAFTCAESTSTVSTAEGQQGGAELAGKKQTKQTHLKHLKNHKKLKYSLSSPRVMVQHFCQVLPKRHMQILWGTLKMTDCVTNFRKYSIKSWKYIIFDNGCYYYRRYDIVIVTLSWALCVCVCVLLFFVLNYWVI